MTPPVASARTTSEAFGWRAAQLGGTQLISLLRLLVLARIVAPDAFGLVAVATVTIGLLMGLSNLGVVQALVQRESPRNEEYDAAWTLGVLRAAVVTAVLMLIGPLVAGLYGEPAAGPIVRAMALRPLIDAAGSIGVARLTRTLAFRRLAFMALPASVIDAVTAIALAPAFGVWALVIGTLAGALVQTALSYVLAPHRPRFRLDAGTTTPLVRYGQWIMLTGIVGLVATSITQMALSRTLGVAALGVYVVASRLAFLPSVTAGAVVGAVAFPLYAAHRDDDHRRAATFGALFTGQAMVLYPVIAIIIALAPAFEAAMGGRWAGTAPTTQILAAACIIGVFGETVTPLLLGRGRADRAFQLELVQSAVRLILLWPLMRLFGIPGAALAWLGGNAAAQVVSVTFARDDVRASICPARKRLVAAALASVLAAAVAASLGAILTGFTALVVGGGAAVLIAAGTLWLLDRLQDLRLPELLPWHANWGPRATPPTQATLDA